ncbi:HipA domain-containing protein [Candidatus Poriferisodalis sp.]|uniref:HipA domain-containing protein n=1 Tax=Candidatus Poriferisodalis sp. TaxID=3101277 RepID=UPI003B51BDAB
MTAPLAILLGGRQIGTVSAAGDFFAYDADYLDDKGATVPLSLSMPLTQQRHPGAVIRAWLQGLLPDNAELLRYWQQITGAASSDPLDLLATAMGLDCAGAVQVCPADEVDAAMSRGGRYEPLSDSDVAQRLTSVRQRTHLARDVAAPGYFSLAGAQAKIALHRHLGEWHQPHGTAVTTHILKPAVFMTQHQAVVEHLSMATARRLGLPAAATEVTEFGGFDTVVVERYDRRRVGDLWLRLHQEDMCQALGVTPSLRYEQHGGPSPSQFVALLRRHSSAPADDIADLLDALAYNWIIAAPDGHAKNFGLLLEFGEVRLAPMYDVCSVLPYLEQDEPFMHAFSIGGSHIVTPSDAVPCWTRCAAELGVPAEALLARISNIAAAVPEACAAEAAALRGSLSASPRVSQLLDRLEARTKACLAHIG